MKENIQSIAKINSIDKKKDKKRTVLTAFLLLTFMLGISAYAGTTDNLGLQSTWTTVSGWLSDGYATKIISFLLFVYAIEILLSGGKKGAGLLILVIAIVIANLGTIVNTFASATF